MMKYFAGLLAIVALVAGATVGAYHLWDAVRGAGSPDDNGGVLGAAGPSTLPPNAKAPRQGVVVVKGTITSAHAEGATLTPLPTPFTVDVATRGEGGATITGVEVKNKSTSIAWDGGQPLPFTGDGGSLVLDAVTVDATPDGISIGLDGGVHGFAPGTYTLGSSVAVGDRPQDSVTFTATDKSTVTFQGGASTPFAGMLIAKGTGKVTLEGNFSVVRHDRSVTMMSSITFDNGAYLLGLTPGADGIAVDATLQGTIH
jgi:hypothetical protein